MDRQKAQSRADQIQAFWAELERLEAEGISPLSAEEKVAVRHHHDSICAVLRREFDVDVTIRDVKLSIAMKIVSALGALAFCLALGALVQRYWGVLDTWMQILMLVGAPVSAILLAEFAAQRERTYYFTSLLCLVALAAYFVGLRTLGEIFAMTPTPGAVGCWAALSLWFAYRYQLRLQLVLGLSLLLALVPMTIFYFGGFAWENPLERPEILVVGGTSLGWLALRQRGPFAAPMRGVAVSVVLLCLLLFSTWGYGSFLPLARKVIESVYTFLCFAASGAGIALGIRRNWGEMVLLSATCFAGLLITKMYDWLWDAIPAFLFFALIGILSLGMLFAFRRLRDRQREAAA